jgi:ribosomal protein L2
MTVGIVTSLEYDPNRNTNIASIYDFLKKIFLYPSTQNLKIGDIVKSGANAEPKIAFLCPSKKFLLEVTFIT